jgi:8-oxo-dGTP diphosphatase
MIGPFVFCPRCGARLIQQFLFGRERPVCPACGYIVFYDPKVAVGALVEHEGKVLLVRRRYDPGRGGWALPAGFVEIDEGPVAAAIRECREETGVIIRVCGVLDVFAVPTDPRGPAVFIVYRGVPVGGDLRPGDDALEAGFFPPNRLPSPLVFASTCRALLRWRREKGFEGRRF